MAKCLKSLSERLDLFLRKTAISHGEFAKKAGISAPYLSQLLNRKNENPGVQQLEGVASAMGLTLAELLMESDQLKRFGDHDIHECYRRIGEELKKSR